MPAAFLPRALHLCLLAARHRRRRPLAAVQEEVVCAAKGAAHALHREGARGRGVQNGEFLGRQPLGKEQGADGDEQEDEDGEADGGDGLRDGEGGAEADQLDDDKEPDGAAADAGVAERVRRRGEGDVADEEQDLGGNSVAFEGLETHDEEETRQDTLGDQVQDSEEGPGHGDKGQKALSEVRQALLDDVGGAEGEGGCGFCVAGVLLIRDHLGDAERFGMEGGLRDETVGERQAEEAGDAGGKSEEEDVPVETSGLLEGKFAALGDKRRDCGPLECGHA